jgi:hypothetical protein
MRLGIEGLSFEYFFLQFKPFFFCLHCIVCKTRRCKKNEIFLHLRAFSFFYIKKNIL